MRRFCPTCGAILIIRKSQKGHNIGRQFYGCQNFPICKYTEEISNSLFTDEEIHEKIFITYPYDHIFLKEEIISIASDFNLSLNSFFYWIAKEKAKYIDNDLYFHNYINNVGSPYNFTFKSICESINKYYENSLSKIQELNFSFIEVDIAPFMIERKKRLDEKDERWRKGMENARKEAIIHEENRKKKAEKASNDIFNAIKRRDVKAIIALIKKGALVNIPNNEGITALEYAERLGNLDVIDVLNMKLAQ